MLRHDRVNGRDNPRIKSGDGHDANRAWLLLNDRENSQRYDSEQARRKERLIMRKSGSEERKSLHLA